MPYCDSDINASIKLYSIPGKYLVESVPWLLKLPVLLLRQSDALL